ncbi:GNAT family N-acetyltransferase [Amycolatopsis sp. cg5]|uniref:GNAT family N-acetyltransferase n=1 Tax=Amycolatopsis sp. cg5 TaxID=3238802 RepID=UPI00352316BA
MDNFTWRPLTVGDAQAAMLLEAGIAAAKVVHALHHPERELVIDVHKAEHIAGVPELVRAQGFAPARYFQRMEHPLGDAPGPVPDRLEPWSPDNDEDFRLVRNEAYQDCWGAVPMPTDHWRNKITNQTFQPDVSFLARDTDGTAIGVLVTMSWEADTAATGIRDAHFTVIGTRREHRNRGVASTLIGHALATAAARGYDRASLNADSASASGGFRLFEKAGFTPKQRYVRWELAS